MGLLDDAIRQHLELKRRHGADPSEVARQEQEALGPPRRGTAAEELELADRDELVADEAEAYDNGDERLAEEPSVETEPEPLEPVDEPEAQAGAVSALDQPTQVYDPGDLEDPDADPEGQAQAQEADAREDARGPEPEGAAPDAPDSGKASEDVLEETPEFLQETPEHDRLWFEQKPPRDFDF